MRGISLPGLAYLLNLASVGVFGMRSGTAAFTVFRQRGEGLFYGGGEVTPFRFKVIKER